MLFREILLYLELEIVAERLDKGTLFENGVLIWDDFLRSRTAAPSI